MPTETLDYHYQTVGRILAYLIENGLKKINIEPSDAMPIMTETWGTEEEVLSSFSDIIEWMLDEGLIRAEAKSQSLDGPTSLFGVQLTSKGIGLIQIKPENDKSIEETIRDAPKEGLDAQTYTKIGAFAGAALGGLIKSIS